MKYIYLKPTVDVIKVYGEMILNTGSVYDSNGNKVGGMGSGGDQGSGDQWIDAKRNGIFGDESDE